MSEKILCENIMNRDNPIASAPERNTDDTIKAIASVINRSTYKYPHNVRAFVAGLLLPPGASCEKRIYDVSMAITMTSNVLTILKPTTVRYLEARTLLRDHGRISNSLMVPQVNSPRPIPLQSRHRRSCSGKT